MTEDEKLRLECLRLALQQGGHDAPFDVEKAEAYYTFVTGGAAIPSITASGLRAEYTLEAQRIMSRAFSRPEETSVS